MHSFIILFFFSILAYHVYNPKIDLSLITTYMYFGGKIYVKELQGKILILLWQDFVVSYLWPSGEMQLDLSSTNNSISLQVTRFITLYFYSEPGKDSSLIL